MSFECTSKTFKNSKGSSKQYFGNKKALAETSKGGFDEYDPFHDDSYLASPDDEQIELLGTIDVGVTASSGGSELSEDPTDQGGETPPPPPFTPPPLILPKLKELEDI